MNVLSLFDGKYEITTDGKIFSTVGKRKELKGKINKYGYRMVVLTVNKKKIYPNLHRLIAINFIPNPNKLPEINHKDGNKANNHISNLEWCTSSENQKHARDTGLQKYKINMQIANQIRDLYKTGKYTHLKLSNMFGLQKTQIGYIINNKRWI